MMASCVARLITSNTMDLNASPVDPIAFVGSPVGMQTGVLPSLSSSAAGAAGSQEDAHQSRRQRGTHHFPLQRYTDQGAKCFLSCEVRSGTGGRC